MTISSDIISVASVLASAFAALASWASADQDRQDARERRRPSLLGAVQQIEDPNADEEVPTHLNVLNAGGTAKNVACVLAIGNHYFANRLGHGFLRNRQEARAETEMPMSSNRRSILIYQDLKQRVWVSDLDGNVRSYSPRNIDLASDFRAFWLDFYGEDLNLLTRVGSRVTI